ncbi:hypothetical protein MMC26_003379 [Xylographa opegraphella]|nr:hypothetical protein [Xylographa opegraphella]
MHVAGARIGRSTRSGSYRFGGASSDVAQDASSGQGLRRMWYGEGIGIAALKDPSSLETGWVAEKALHPELFSHDTEFPFWELVDVYSLVWQENVGDAVTALVTS